MSSLSLSSIPFLLSFISYREHGAVPLLVNLMHHQDLKVQITTLRALRNLSSGSSSNKIKLEIARDQGLVEIITVLRSSHVKEIRDLLTSLLWNLSSCEELKLQMIQCCLHNLVEIMMVPLTGWSMDGAQEANARPKPVHWNLKLKNTTGDCVFIKRDPYFIHFLSCHHCNSCLFCNGNHSAMDATDKNGGCDFLCCRSAAEHVICR